MNEHKKKILLISISCLVMIGFVYFEFFHGKSTQKTDQQLINPARLDDSPSRTKIYAEKRKKERREFNFDRKVGSLEHFLESQVEKDPFTDSASIEREEIQPDSAKKEPQVIEKIVYVYPQTTKEQDQEENDNHKKTSGYIAVKTKPRKVGFASGGVSSDKAIAETADKSIMALAVVHESVSVKSGSDLKLRIVESFQFGEITIPENTFAVGRVRFSRDHIYIEVGSIPVGGQILSTNLTAYDLNGSKGIYVEGGLEKQIKTDILEEGINQVQRNVNVPLLRDVPFSSAKKKIREPEVLIEAGHKIYLKEQ